MTHAISDILANKWEEPPEIAAIKTYIQEQFDETVSVGVQPTHLTIYVANAALAATLRMHIRQLQKAAQTDKRLVIRIGH